MTDRSAELKPEVCANCGENYAHHMQTTQCYPDSDDRWFPKSLADAITDAQNTRKEDAND